MEQEGIKEFKQDDLDYSGASDSAKIPNIYYLDWKRLEVINLT